MFITSSLSPLSWFIPTAGMSVVPLSLFSSALSYSFLFLAVSFLPCHVISHTLFLMCPVTLSRVPSCEHMRSTAPLPPRQPRRPTCKEQTLSSGTTRACKGQGEVYRRRLRYERRPTLRILPRREPRSQIDVPPNRTFVALVGNELEMYRNRPEQRHLVLRQK